MSNPRYPEELKIQAVNQVTEKKLPVADVAARRWECTPPTWQAHLCTYNTLPLTQLQPAV
ncbi:hypothetical protein D3C75_515240 [compost metagenome]|jgi:transposase-like protein